MDKIYNYSRRLSTVLLIFFASVFQVQNSYAEMVSTGEVLSKQQLQADRQKVQAFVDRTDVQKALRSLGVKPEEAKMRVDALTDNEVKTLANRIDSLPAGGTLSEMDFVIILLIAILVAIAI